MENNNICRFIPYINAGDKINIINYVFETKPQKFESLKCSSVYVAGIVNSGTGNFHTPGKVHRLEKGDIFFVIAAAPYAIESVSEFSYTYISYIGTRAYSLLEKLKINGSNCVFKNFEHLLGVWESGFDAPHEFSDIMCESILLYTFASISKSFEDLKSGLKENQTSVRIIKKFIDDNISDSTLCIGTISRNLSYSPKYISAVFKRKYKIGISEYITLIRVQHACTLMNQGFGCVKEIAAICGYKDALYFSKVFKSRLGVTPSQYINDIEKQKN